MVQVRDRQCYIVARDSARLNKYIRSTPQMVGGSALGQTPRNEEQHCRPEVTAPQPFHVPVFAQHTAASAPQWPV